MDGTGQIHDSGYGTGRDVDNKLEIGKFWNGFAVKNRQSKADRTGLFMQRTIGCLMVFCILLLTSGCENAGETDTVGKTKPVPQARVQPESGTASTPDGVEVIEEQTFEDLPDSSFDLIEAALAKGTVTRVESIDLKLTAIFDSDKLPEHFRGDDQGYVDVFHNIKWDIQWLYDHWDALTEKQKDRFYPYLALPDDPESIHNPDRELNDEASFFKKIRFVPSAYAAPANATFFFKQVKTSSKKKISLAAFLPKDLKKKSEYKKKIAAVRESIKYVFPKLKTYFGTDIKKELQVLICHLPKFDGLANKTVTLRHNDGTTRDIYYIRLSETLNENQLKATFAHELFHIFQFNAGAEYDTNDNKWLMETTAVWVENYIYPTYDTEHQYSKDFFSSLNRHNLFTVYKNYEYSRHLFIRFLTQYFNDDQLPEKLIKQGLVNRKVRQAVEKALDDKNKTFAEYSVYNWNKSPFRKYSDPGSFPTFTPPFKTIRFKKRRVYRVPYGIKPTLQTNVVYRFDKDILKFPIIRFKFEPKTTQKPVIVALLKTPSGWQRENWTGETEKEFIRVDGPNRVDRVALLMTNPDFNQPVEFQLTVDTTLKENAVLSINHKSVVEAPFDDGNVTTTYEGGYTALMDVDFDDTVNSYYIKRLKAVYRGRTVDTGNIISAKSTGRIDRQLNREKEYLIYRIGEELLCQFWPYLGEKYVEIDRSVQAGDKVLSFAEKGIPASPEFLLNNIRFKPGNEEITLKQGALTYRIRHTRDKNAMKIMIKYGGPGVTPVLDMTTEGESKGTIKYIHYLN